jgi:hypothetical protein
MKVMIIMKNESITMTTFHMTTRKMIGILGRNTLNQYTNVMSD